LTNNLVLYAALLDCSDWHLR